MTIVYPNKSNRAARQSHSIDPSKFFIAEFGQIPQRYRADTERLELFEVFWYTEKGTGRRKMQRTQDRILLIPPFRILGRPLLKKDGYFIAFHREYLEEDDKEFALDVFNLFNQQGQYRDMEIPFETQTNLHHIRKLMQYEAGHANGTYLSLKPLIKVFLINLIRLLQQGFLEQDVNQKRVYDFIILLDDYYIAERTTGFYAGKLGISPKRLNQILQEKMNATATHLIHARLLLEAKRKLTASDFTIKEIAFQLNFKDHSYFSRFFKRQSGYTPEDYKTMTNAPR